MLFLNKIFKVNILVLLLFLICLTKSVISYTEELFLFTVYVSLFSVILRFSGNAVRLNIVTDVLKVIEFYEKFIYVIMLLFLYIQKVYNLIKVLSYSKFQVNVINYILKKKQNLLKTFNKKLKFNYIYLFIYDLILSINLYNINTIK